MNKSNDQFYEPLITTTLELNIIRNSKYNTAFKKCASLAASLDFIDF